MIMITSQKVRLFQNESLGQIYIEVIESLENFDKEKKRMKQQIKCPHCNKLFPIEDSLKHEAQELRKKLQSEEQKKSKEKCYQKLL